MHLPDLTKGNIPRLLWSLAWPMMLTMFFYTLYNIVDAFWVSKLSPEAIAAVSISQITLFIMISLGFGVTVGSGVIMGMHIGAKNMDAAERMLGQSFVLSGLLGVLFTVIALVFRRALLTASGAGGAVFEPALEYYTIIAGGSILMFLMTTVMFAFNSQGDNTTPTKLFAISTSLNAILAPIMIFGWLGCPALGIGGAAYATLISQLIFLLIAIRSLAGVGREIRFRFRNLRVEWGSVKRILNIGFPASLTQVVFPIGLAALTHVISMSFKEAGTVAFSLGFRMEFFAYLPAAGFGFGAMAMISQNLGARNLDRARECFYTALKCGFAGSMGLGILAAVFAVPFIGLFTDDPTVTAYAKTYMWTVALSYGFLAGSLIEAPSFQAIGRAWPGFWIFVTRMAIMIGLSYLLTKVFAMSIMGVWVSILTANIVSATIGYILIVRALNGMAIEEIPISTTEGGMAPVVHAQSVA